MESMKYKIEIAINKIVDINKVEGITGEYLYLTGEGLSFFNILLKLIRNELKDFSLITEHKKKSEFEIVNSIIYKNFYDENISDIEKEIIGKVKRLKNEFSNDDSLNPIAILKERYIKLRKGTIEYWEKILDKFQRKKREHLKTIEQKKKNI